MSIELTVMSLDFDSDEAPNIKTYEQETITLGRGPDNDVVLAGAEVSTNHANITIQANGASGPTVFVTDLGSANGTLVDNVPLVPNEPRALQKNERILISGYLIKPVFKENGSAPQAGDSADLLNRTIVISEDSPLVNFEELQAEEEQVVEQVADEEQSTAEPVVEVAVEAEQEPSVEPESEDTYDATAVVDPLEALVDSTDAIEEEPAEELVVSEPEQEQEIVATEDSVSAIADPQVLGPITGVVGGAGPLVFDFEAQKLCQLKGRVEHNGSGLAGVKVSAGELGNSETDADGYFYFENVAEETSYELLLEKEKYLIADSPATGTIEDSLELSFQAKELFTIQGFIKHKGQALAGVVVDAGPLGEAVTDEDGKYVFENVPEGTEFSIQPKKTGFKISGAG